ncbi:MAG: ribbon-helix-helix domain-containing protein, partial [Blastocatellales bacterium]
MFLGMKVKTSITISEETLKTIDEYSGERVSRSEFIEKAIQSYLAQLIKNAR